MGSSLVLAETSTHPSAKGVCSLPRAPRISSQKCSLTISHLCSRAFSGCIALNLMGSQDSLGGQAPADLTSSLVVAPTPLDLIVYIGEGLRCWPTSFSPTPRPPCGGAQNPEMGVSCGQMGLGPRPISVLQDGPWMLAQVRPNPRDFPRDLIPTHHRPPPSRAMPHGLRRHLLAQGTPLVLLPVGGVSPFPCFSLQPVAGNHWPCCASGPLPQGPSRNVGSQEAWPQSKGSHAVLSLHFPEMLQTPHPHSAHALRPVGELLCNVQNPAPMSLLMHPPPVPPCVMACLV